MISQKEKRAIKTLKNNKDIVILPADKGQATVIMSQDMYRDKMMELLNSNEYQLLKWNPTFRIEVTMRSALKQVEELEMIPMNMKKDLSPYNSLTPQLYGLPKNPQARYSYETHSLHDQFSYL